MSDYPTAPFSLGAGYIDDAEVNAVKAEVEAMQTDVADLKTKAMPTDDGETGMEFLARVDVYDLLTDDEGDQLVDDAGNQLFAPKYDNISARVEALEKGAKTIIISGNITESEWKEMGYTAEDFAKSFVQKKIWIIDAVQVGLCGVIIPTPDGYAGILGSGDIILIPILYADLLNAVQNELKKG